jgi:PEP-CTERM/exosortase A-associated glycosyltransferase
MHVLHVFDHSIPLHSGYTFRSRSILREQRARGWTTSHITGSKQGKIAGSEETVDDLLFYRTPVSDGLMAKLPVLNQYEVIRSLTRRLMEVARAIKPDVIHAHSPALNGVAALNVGRALQIPVVYEVRAFWEDAAVDHGTSSEGGLRYKLTRALETYVLQRATAVTCICEGLRNDIVQRGIPADKVTVIPNAVEANAFTFGSKADPALAEKLGLSGKTVLGFIGSFYHYEGIPLLLKALPLIRKTVEDVKLLLVGGGPEDERIRQMAQDPALRDMVIFTGRVPHQDVQRYYDLVDVFAYPRINIRLTDLVTPLKPLEAMAQGRLVIASDVGGHKELIEHGKNGFLFKADDAQALAACVVDMLSAREQWESLRRNGRDYVENVRNWNVSVANYQRVYGQCGILATTYTNSHSKW